MSGKKGKTSSSALSAPAPSTSNPGTPITHTDISTAHHTATCSCEKEMQKLLDTVIHPLVLKVMEVSTRVDSLTEISNSLIRQQETQTTSIATLIEKFPTAREAKEIPNSKLPTSNINAIKSQITELQSKTETRFALLESSVAQLRSSIADKLQFKTQDASPAISSDMPPSISKTISSIQSGLRNLNKRIRKNNIVIHGLDNSKQDCITQAENFFQTHLKLKLPVQQAYRLGSSTTDRNAPLLVVFPSLHNKLIVFKHCKLLAGSKFSIQDDLTSEERSERNRKLPIFKNYRAQKKKVTFRGSDLYVDGNLLPC